MQIQPHLGEVHVTAETRTTSYYCDRCKSHRRFKFDHRLHQSLVADSASGLVPYSDIHICQNGLTAVNQLDVDLNYNIRSYEEMKLPLFRTQTFGVPAARSQTNEKVKFIHLTRMPLNIEIHLVIKDHMTKTYLKIGRFDHRTLIPITTLSTEVGGIEIEVYPTGINYSPVLEQWFQALLRILEILPPTTLGLLIDTLRYISDHHERPPSEADFRFIKTILASHEVHFLLEDEDKVSHLRQKYGDSLDETYLTHLNRFIEILRMNKLLPIKAFTAEVNLDLIALIQIFLVLENEGIISIERPGIMDD